jgi:hypothetical protein
MRRVLAVLLVTTFVVATAAPAAHAGGHGVARVAIGLAAFAIFAPLIIVGEALAQIAPYPAPAIVVAPPSAYYAPPPAYSAPAPTYSALPAPLVQREVVYPHGKYVLYGDGVRQAWQWVWVPAVPAVPPPPPPPQ